MIVRPRISAMDEEMPGHLLLERRIADIHQKHCVRAVVGAFRQQVRLTIDVELRNQRRNGSVCISGYDIFGSVMYLNFCHARAPIDRRRLVLWSAGTLASALYG